MISYVGSVVDQTLSVGFLQAKTFFGREKLLLDLSREGMEALRVRLGGQVSQLKRAGLA
jgi:hypothetical protein